MRRRAAERRRLVGLVRGREPWVGHNTIGPLRGWTRWSPNLADRGRRPNLESGAGLGPRFQGEPVAPPTLSPVGHDGAEARVAAFGHWDKQEPADRHIGRLKSDAVHVPHRVGIRAEARGDTRDRLAVANHMDGGIDGRDHDRLTRPELGRVLYPVVVSDGLRRDPVPRRDRKKRLAWRDRVDLEARRVLP